MRITTYKEPFWHTIFEDYYSPEEEQLVWQEVEFLSIGNKLLQPEATEDYRAENKTGCILKNVYKDLSFSSIERINQRIFTKEFYMAIRENPFSKYLLHPACTTFNHIQYYLNNGRYNQHQDGNVLSFVCPFYKQPKKFTGGELKFGNYTPQLKHNTAIMFPSCEWHNVETVIVDEEDVNRGLSRYTVCQFVSC